MRRIRLTTLLVLPALALAGCNDDETTGPTGGEFTFSFSGLPALGHGRYYEAWIGIEGAGGLRHGIERISAGKFVVNADGSVGSPEGGAAEFSLSDPAVLADAVEVLVTVESEGATEAGPALLGGAVTGDEDAGQATLTTAYHHAVGADLAAAAGGFVLATPTDGEGSNETQGVWFTDSVGTPGLSLPVLGHGWIYHAHVLHGGHSLSLGKFQGSAGPDSDGGGAEAGAQAAFAAPGSDFLVSAHDFADGSSTVFVVIEPETDTHAQSALRHDSSFPVRVLEAAVPAGATPREVLPLGNPGALPTATVAFTR